MNRGMRDFAAALDALRRAGGKLGGRPVKLMEVCGGQTHSIVRHGLDSLLPPGVEFLHGPGCPVCVTPAAYLDRAIGWALHVPGLVLCSFGDLWRVPSARSGTLYDAKARGADIRMVASPLDAVAVARDNPSRPVAFLAIGFETTAPANALALLSARRLGLRNFFVSASQFLVPPVLRAVCAEPAFAPDAFLAAGHVCAVTGVAPYRALARELHRPVVVAGFSPAEILSAAARALLQLAGGRCEAENAYPGVVREDGNPAGWRAVEEVFEVCDREWRGLGVIPASGLRLRPGFAPWNADLRFGDAAPAAPAEEVAACPAADVLLGRLSPPDCPHFGRDCTPATPLGAPMVSPEGACAAYSLHRPPRG